MFLPAADIPTFVGEGLVDLGITGWDQIQEYDAAVRASAAYRAVSDKADRVGRCEMVMELDFGGCRLQVQVPEKGEYKTGQDLIGRKIGTSFVHLATDYFAKLEAQAAGQDLSKESGPTPRELRTKIISLSGSVEAACALGVADGIVDLVGKYLATLPTICV